MKRSALMMSLVLLAGLVAPAAAQDLTDEQVAEATTFAVNNSMFVLYHEIGHLYVGEFGLPVLGKEEDAADSLASVTLLQSEDPEAVQALSDAADGWYLSESSRDGDVYENADFYDEHSLDIQRAFSVVCLMVGADPKAFGEIADEYEIDADRRDSCAADYDEASASWNNLLDPHKRNGGAGHTIKTKYEAASADYADIEELLKNGKFLEKATKYVSDTYALPRDLTFRGTECGEENAFYTKDDAEIVFCYEMMGLFYDLASKDLLAPPATGGT